MRMWRRRGAGDEGASMAADAATVTDEAGNSAEADGGPAGAADPRAHGPWDIAEKPVPPDDPSRWDFGSILVLRHPDLERRYQVDQSSGQVTAVMFVAGDGAMELRAYAVPRNEDLWESLRAQLADEAGKRGGKAVEVKGPFGDVPALHTVLPVTGPDGQQAVQPSTILGVPGPRWLLRASMYGRPAGEFRGNGLLETLLLTTVVNRGTAPMAPGDLLPLTVPTEDRGSKPGGDAR